MARVKITRHGYDQIGHLHERAADLVDALRQGDTAAMREYVHNIQYHCSEILEELPGPTLAERMSAPAASVVPDDEVVADGFCPRCGALADEACQTPSGKARDDHAVRRPMPPTKQDELLEDDVPWENQ